MGTGEQRFTLWHGLLLAEGPALAIALIMPITPARFGSGRGLAHLLAPEPTYLQEVLVCFLLTNVMILILGAVLRILWKRSS